MKRLAPSVVVAAALVACGATQDARTADVAALRTRIEADARADRFAGAALLARLDGGKPQILLREAYGLANREKGIANTIDTRFRIGSMNKMFTGTAILQLVQAGKITLTDPVGKYVPDYPNEAIRRKVTIHQLLTHTGGTGDIFGPEYDAHHLKMITHDDWIKLYGKRDPLFEPGSRYAYSNFGMVMLGVVIERVSGKSYYDYVSEHIYRPAKMTQSGLPPEEIAEDLRSIGYSRQNSSSTWAPRSIVGNRGIAAGGGFSTVGDLVNFAAALMSHKLLNAEHTTLLITGKVDSGRGAQYAYGFGDMRKNGIGSVGHAGGAPGMNGDLRIYPDTGYVFAVLSNLDPPAAQAISAFVNERVLKW